MLVYARMKSMARNRLRYRFADKRCIVAQVMWVGSIPLAISHQTGLPRRRAQRGVERSLGGVMDKRAQLAVSKIQIDRIR